MKNSFKVLMILSLFILFSCSKDEDENNSPEIEAQSFSVSESAVSSYVIGKVIAIDTESGELSYSIVTNSDNLFKISDIGELNLLEDYSLDRGAASSHVLTVQVSDGSLTASAKITINVIGEKGNDI